MLSLSGEDHGVASVAGVTRTRGAEETPSMVTGKQFVKEVNTRHVLHCHMKHMLLLMLSQRS